ncbi:type II toxin-antitoxin system RelE/ParE family toxin [Deinococcus radiophilus]|uniref:Plasmid maintenance system killer n=1 Tax=Deinococcus radiophilus TaxID=32062 RepID=A0A431VT30_9DEIO|nr:type II toxin-antitoxin system RelE/ParE family toxin [Deinococcus radiophilus]RTR26360.1 plasmid maintenance system killer [Deinococcus radiophilus]UFA51991.1 type II toxin-antitoxin system RelE/ParE family toxin [Deinococcus radiophilus]
MQVEFRTKKLRKQYESEKAATKAYGPEVARKYVQRIGIIKQTASLEELQAQRPLRCHALKGNRQGEWAINLTGFMRLIFTFEDEELTIVCIEEVSKHYDD